MQIALGALHPVRSVLVCAFYAGPRSLEASWDLLQPIPWEMRVLHDFFPTPEHLGLLRMINRKDDSCSICEASGQDEAPPTSGKGVWLLPQ